MVFVWICVFKSCWNNNNTILLSSHISTRRYAPKSRRRESGTHSKKLKTQWGEDKFFFLFFSENEGTKTLKKKKENLKTTLETQAERHLAMCATAASNWSEMSCVCFWLFPADHSRCCCHLLSISEASPLLTELIYTHTLLHVVLAFH